MPKGVKPVAAGILLIKKVKTMEVNVERTNAAVVSVSDSLSNYLGSCFW